MRYVETPFDQETPDKIIGGKLTAREGACYSPTIFMTFIITSSDGFVLSRFLIQLGIAVLLIIVGSVFAFKKVDKDHLEVYLVKLIKFKLRQKTFTYDKY
ncbi:PrgI family protein (plasmid) [Vallitalea pronyensis]|uniref:PrgI family protein n=1 Tax=Vallitalea pronyensis TaxID=1348613 RepID=A0A8J8SJR8_9FIRM|nr:PrgI family protein [Vallitalea pronyensis]QUI25901.1 PrgI family protein [Vallitalea pronyensis]